MQWISPYPRMCRTQAQTEAWPLRIWTGFPAEVPAGRRRMHTNPDMPRDLHYPLRVCGLIPMEFLVGV